MKQKQRCLFPRHSGATHVTAVAVADPTVLHLNSSCLATRDCPAQHFAVVHYILPLSSSSLLVSIHLLVNICVLAYFHVIWTST